MCPAVPRRAVASRNEFRVALLCSDLSSAVFTCAVPCLAGSSVLCAALLCCDALLRSALHRLAVEGLVQSGLL